MKKKFEILETINNVHIQQQCSVQSRKILNIQILKYSVYQDQIKIYWYGSFDLFPSAIARCVNYH